MSNEVCKVVCWLVAIVVGVFVGYIVANGIGLGFLLGLIAGLIVCVLVGMYLPPMVCGSAQESSAAAPQASAQQSVSAPKPASAPQPTAPAAPAPAPKVAEPQPEPAKAASAAGGHWSDNVAAESGMAGGGRGATGLKPTVVPAEEANLRDGVGAWKYESDAKPYRSAAAAAPESAAPAAAPAAAGVDYDGDGVIEGVNEGEKPSTLDGPRGGQADDLKKIKGVGPALEKLLHSLGFYHFDQVAAWSAQEVAWVDANLGGFKGRVSRDGWVEQAKQLATGGETEFSKKVDKGGVY